MLHDMGSSHISFAHLNQVQALFAQERKQPTAAAPGLGSLTSGRFFEELQHPKPGLVREAASRR